MKALLHISRIVRSLAVALLLMAAHTLLASSHPCNETGPPGCDDSQCQNFVCAIDPYCCSVEWDGICVAEAEAFCPNLCGNYKVELCHSPWWSNNCHTSCVPFYVLWWHLWHGDFVGPCTENCEPPPPPPPPGEGDCCEVHNTPGCNDLDCEAAVCAIDNFCCETGWDGFCVQLAIENCGELCPSDPQDPSDCCQVHNTAGCDDADCEAAVCAIDDFCCTAGWDGFCVQLAIENCGELCPPESTVPLQSQQVNAPATQGAQSGRSSENAADGGAKYVHQHIQPLPDDINDRYIKAYPNPAYDHATISFSWPTDARGTLEIYSMQGQRISAPFDGQVEPNVLYEVDIDASAMPSGMYVYKLQFTSGRFLHGTFVVQR